MVSLGIPKYWPIRLVVRTPGFHPVDVAGSIPVSSTCQDSSVVEQGSCKAQVVGSNPIPGSRVSYNGNTSAFQADAVGSIPSTRSLL